MIGIQESAHAADHTAELLHVGLRDIALKGRGLDALDGQARNEMPVAARGIPVASDHSPAAVTDGLAQGLDFGRRRVSGHLGSAQPRDCDGAFLAARLDWLLCGLVCSFPFRHGSPLLECNPTTREHHGEHLSTSGTLDS